jgi:ABC-type glycerol-3-phosphate transport system substrate-binding protein
MSTKGVKFMVPILRRAIALVALAVGIGVAAGTAPAAAATSHATHVTVHAPSHLRAVSHTDDWWFT